MLRFSFLLLLVVFVYGCQDNQKPTKPNLSNTEKTLKRALLNGYYSQITEDIGVSFYQNNMYVFSSNDKPFPNEKFLLHLVKSDGSFDNNDFFKNDFIISDSLSSDFATVNVLHKKINYEPYKRVRVGQFLRNPDQSTTNIWVKEILTDDILKRKTTYENQLSTEDNLINEDFKKNLRYGKFFKTNSDFYILLLDHEMFFITKDDNDIKDKMMLHFIKEDNTFNNLSFNFNSREYQQFLENPYRGLKIAKIVVPEDDVYPKIRIGQFNENGNIWVQEFFIKDIYENKLLEYDNEFEN